MTISKLSKEQVFNACNLLVSQGKKPTLDNVRSYVGSGSRSTIAKWVKTWRDENPEIGNDRKQFIAATNEALEKFYEFWTLSVMQAEQKTDNDYIAVLEAENEKLKEEIMNYQEMKIRMEIQEKTMTELLAKIGVVDNKNSESNEALQKKIAELENSLDKVNKENKALIQVVERVGVGENK